MKRIYSKKSSISQLIIPFGLNQSILSHILIFLSVIFLIFSLFSPNQTNQIRNITTDILSPVISFVSKPFEILSNSISSITGLATLRAENSSLRAENARLKEWYQTALMLQAENQSLQKLLNVKIEPQKNYLTSRVISDVTNNFAKTILVAAGTRDGLKRNHAVLSGDGMIGRIINPGENTSRVLLLTDINSRLPVLIQGTNQKAILMGNNSEMPALKHLPKDTGIAEGVRIVTSGDGGVFPPNLPVGRVIKGEQGQFYVHLYSDVNRMAYVRIVDTTSPKNLIRNN